jgi:hypothetical protein
VWVLLGNAMKAKQSKEYYLLSCFASAFALLCFHCISK